MGCIGSKAAPFVQDIPRQPAGKAEGKQDGKQGWEEPEKKPQSEPEKKPQSEPEKKPQSEPEKKPQNGWDAAQQPPAAASAPDRHSHVIPDTEAQVRSLSCSSSFSSTRTPAAADSDTPPSPDPSSQPSPGEPPGEVRDSKGFLIKNESTKRSPEAGLSPGVLELGWTDGHEPESEPSPEPFPGPRDPQAAKLRNGQDAEISMSDDEEEEDNRPSHSAGEGFDMQRWKRYYQWNYRKPDDLLAFFWKRFDPRAWSLYCVSYRHQDALFAPFQGENVIHGASCRLEAAIQGSSKPLSSSVFGLLHALSDGDAAKLKVVGIFIVRGHKPPSAILRVLDEEEWSLVKAEANDPVVREFVSNLIAPRPNKSTVEDYHITCTRTV